MTNCYVRTWTHGAVELPDRRNRLPVVDESLGATVFSVCAQCQRLADLMGRSFQATNEGICGLQTLAS